MHKSIKHGLELLIGSHILLHIIPNVDNIMQQAYAHPQQAQSDSTRIQENQQPVKVNGNLALEYWADISGKKPDGITDIDDQRNLERVFREAYKIAQNKSPDKLLIYVVTSAPEDDFFPLQIPDKRRAFATEQELIKEYTGISIKNGAAIFKIDSKGIIVDAWVRYNLLEEREKWEQINPKPVINYKRLMNRLK